MKNLLVGLLVLGSFSSFAIDYTQGVGKNSELCEQEKELLILINNSLSKSISYAKEQRQIDLDYTGGYDTGYDSAVISFKIEETEKLKDALIKFCLD